jgi:hypothetical protein
MNIITGYALAGLLLGLFTSLLFMAGEAAVPPAARLRLANALGGKGTMNWSDVMRIFGGVLDRAFGTDAFSLRFIGTALLLSLLAFLLFFATYLLKLPVFAESLMDDGYQRQAVAGQLLTMFVPMNVFITYLGLAYCREVVMQMERSGRPGRLPLFLAKDLLMKMAIVLLAMGLVYLALTPRGSFSGPGAALLAVPGVFQGALGFQNLNCVYIYSSIVSSLWLWAVLLASMGNAAVVRAVAAVLPVATHPVRAIGLVTAVLTAVFYWIIVLLA